MRRAGAVISLPKLEGGHADSRVKPHTLLQYQKAYNLFETFLRLSGVVVAQFEQAAQPYFRFAHNPSLVGDIFAFRPL